MPRGYSQKLLLQLQNTDMMLLGARLARLCVEANLPASYIAKALQVSNTTVHKWFRGSGIRESKRLVVESLMNIIEEDLKTGRLPVTDIKQARIYMAEISGVNI